MNEIDFSYVIMRNIIKVNDTNNWVNIWVKNTAVGSETMFFVEISWELYASAFTQIDI